MVNFAHLLTDFSRQVGQQAQQAFQQLVLPLKLVSTGRQQPRFQLIQKSQQQLEIVLLHHQLQPLIPQFCFSLQQFLFSGQQITFTLDQLLFGQADTLFAFSQAGLLLFLFGIKFGQPLCQLQPGFIQFIFSLGQLLIDFAQQFFIQGGDLFIFQQNLNSFCKQACGRHRSQSRDALQLWNDLVFYLLGDPGRVHAGYIN